MKTSIMRERESEQNNIDKKKQKKKKKNGEKGLMKMIDHRQHFIMKSFVNKEKSSK